MNARRSAAVQKRKWSHGSDRVCLSWNRCVALVLGLLWLTIRIVRHAWKGKTGLVSSAEAALENVRSACKELRKDYPGVADNFSNGLAIGVFEAHELHNALILALQKLDSGDVSGAKQEIGRIKLRYDEVAYMIEKDREQAKR
jgi:hypothetical protein